MPDPIKYRPTLAPSTAKALNEEGKRAQEDMPAYLKGLIAQIEDPGARTVFENRLYTIQNKNAPDTKLWRQLTTDEYNVLLRVLTDYQGIAGRPTVSHYNETKSPISLSSPFVQPGRAHMDFELGTGNPRLYLSLDKDVPIDEQYNTEWDAFVAEMSHAVDANMRYRNLPKALRPLPYGVEAVSGGIRTAIEGEAPWTSVKQYERPGAMEHRTHSLVEPYYSRRGLRNHNPAGVVRATPWR